MRERALLRLAKACGIEDHYIDVTGRRVDTSPETCAALLGAMSIPVAQDSRALQEACEAVHDQAWRPMLPPVQVVWSDAPSLDVTLVVPVTADGSWQVLIQLEGGSEQRSTFRPQQLARLEERTVDGERLARISVPVPGPCPEGYHRLRIIAPGDSAPRCEPMLWVVAPPACYLPPALQQQGRLWGPALQLYGLRSRRNWGIGDFTDLITLTDLAAASGAGIIGLNPLHALFPEAAEHRSPYSPSSRQFLNPLYLDVEAVPDVQESEAIRERLANAEFQARLRRLRATDCVDTEAVTAVKFEVLRLAYQHFREYHVARDTARARAWQRYRDDAGRALQQHALFEALFAHFLRMDAPNWGWPDWPEQYRSPEGAAAGAFAAEHAQEIEFRCYLQWQADQQLRHAVWHTAQSGLGVGLYRDIALGVDPRGSEAWTQQSLLAQGAAAGAPPDADNPEGQDWGLPPPIPQRLRAAAYAPFVELLRANMRLGGAVRIDHVMGLMRLFWVPAPTSSAAARSPGAYVLYPFEDLLGILALESQRNRCVVVGEDLGTVPAGLRDVLERRGVLSYRPLMFERSPDGGLKPPVEYPHQALAVAGTHDLPTLAGFWLGRDLDERDQLGLFPSRSMVEAALVSRSRDRAWLLIALQRERLLPTGTSLHPVAVPELTPALVQAVHWLLARTPSMLMTVQPEDIFGVVQQVNLPTSTPERPNWCNKLPLDLEDWGGDERFSALADCLRRERGTRWWRGDRPVRPAVIPRATYRLQLNRDFTLNQAIQLVPYLAQLGISHLYASPYLKARPGSRHGYDIVDHNAINPEIGSLHDLQRFVETLEQHAMGHIVDMVPNHMGVMGADNEWWLDVLENGQASRFAEFFDIDWRPLNPELRGKVLLPMLADLYGSVLIRGELKLSFDAPAGELSIHYYQHRLPIDPAEYPRVIGHQFERLASLLGRSSTLLLELQSLLTAFGHLAPRHSTDRVRMTERARDKQVHKRQLAGICATAPQIAQHVATNVAEFNGSTQQPGSFDLLHDLIKAQAWRLAYWRVAADEINYRRFFDINDLAALRMENWPVFEATHGLVLSLVERGWLHGLRIDHADGLYDPGQYFRRLQARAGMPQDAEAQTTLPLYLVIEKILAEHERLPDDWLVHGETGYRFANLVNGLWVDAASEKRLTRIHARFTGARIDYEELVYESKRLIIVASLQSELNVLANRLAAIAASSRFTCDFTLNSLRAALAHVVASFPVYRTYRTDGNLSDTDRRHIEWAVAVGRRHSNAGDTSVFDFVRDVLAGDIATGKDDEYRRHVDRLAMKFQQYTSPVTAKGVEDTAFYRYNRLVSLNDVGSDPSRFGISVQVFHNANRARLERWPHSMLAGSTHDSKRAEDVRARIDVLSEVPAAWKLGLRHWARINRSRRRELEGRPAPSADDEYLVYQTLFGTWPLEDFDERSLADYTERIGAYMQKAAREAKRHTSWLNVDTAYEEALAAFVSGILAPGEKNLFMADFGAAVRRLAPFGLINALSQTLLKLTAPGVPDIYQGCELWSFALVDPDNRRPVDYALRRRLLADVAALRRGAPGQWATALRPLVRNMQDGRIKLYLTWCALQWRRRWPEVFAQGEYIPLSVHGRHGDLVCAYARRHGLRIAVTVVPRLMARRALRQPSSRESARETLWADTRVNLPPDWAASDGCNVLTGEPLGAGPLKVERLFAHFPVALLAYAPGETLSPDFATF